MITEILETLGAGDKPRLVEMGKIKIGGLGESRAKRSGGTFRLPQKHDYFTVTTLQRGQAGDLMPDAALMETLIDKWADHDGKLRQIPVFVLSDDIDDILQVAYVWYGGKVCVGRSDGKTTTWFYDTRTKQKVDPPLVEEFDPEILTWKSQDGSSTLFKLHSVFNCVIAADNSRWGGVYKFRTTSVISFKQLYSSLLHLSQLTGGVLIGMPLMLKVRPVQVAPDGKPSTVYVVHVELMGKDLFEIQKKAMLQAEYQATNRQRLLTAQRQYKALLTGPGQEMNGEVAALGAEFHPESPDLSLPAAPENYGLLDDADSSPSAPASSASGAPSSSSVIGPGSNNEVGTSKPEYLSGEANEDEGAIQEPEMEAPGADAPQAPTSAELATWDKFRTWGCNHYAKHHRIEHVDAATALAKWASKNLIAKDPKKGLEARTALSVLILENGLDLATGEIKG
jgi:hypothetical protein